MAYDIIALLAGIAIFFVILAIVLFSVFNNRISAGKRIRRIRAYKAKPRKIAGAPVLVHGPAGSPVVVMPTGGEPVAFHATFIMSRGCTLFRTPGNNKILPENTSFKIFTMSGDFSVADNGMTYTVSIISALKRFSQGRGKFSKDQKLNAVLDGMPETVFNDVESFEATLQVLAKVFAITTPGTLVISAIDSRVRTFTQGLDVPPAIAELLRQRLIRPQPDEEITIVEFFIPLKKSVYAFGTFDGKDAVRYDDTATALSVSYVDPETMGA